MCLRRRKLYDKREAALDEMLAKRARQESMRSSFRSWLWIRLDKRSTIPRLGQDQTADGASQYEDYKDKQQEDADRPPKEKQYTLLLMAYRSGISSIGSQISREASRIQRENDKRSQMHINYGRKQGI